MITLTIIKEVKKNKILTIVKEMKLFSSTDKARQEIKPIVSEMKRAIREKRNPKIKIGAVSYDTTSEKNLLLELDAITSVENERSEDNY